MSKEALQTAEERREAKIKGERERYTQLNAGSQRIARREKKAFLNEQCKKTEEINSEYSLEGLMPRLQYSGHLMQSSLTGNNPDAGKD